MNEKTTKRKDWIKNAAIVFLVVMLILTFFSNTIMNYSLPQVATDYVSSGTITTKIRGTGTVTSVDPYSVILGGEDAPATTRKIQKLMVQVGDTVEKGDVLLMLDEKTNTALDDLEKAVDAAQDAYDAAKQAPGVTNDIISKGTGSFDSAAYNQQIITAQEDLNAQNKVVADLEKTIAAFNAQLGLTGSESDGKVYAAQSALLDAEKTKMVSEKQLSDENARLSGFNAKYDAYVNAKTAFDAAGQNKSEKNAAYTAAKSAWENATEDEKSSLETAMNSAKSASDAADAEYNVAQTNLTTAEDAYNQVAADKTACEANIAKLNGTINQANENIKKYTYELELAKKEQAGSVGNLTAQKANYELQLKVAQSNQIEKQNLLNELTTNLKLITDIRAARQALKEAKNALSDAQDETIASEVTADVAGTISSIAYKSGQTVSTGETLMVIQPAGQGYTISIPVTTEQSRRVHVGDTAELVNNWWYSEVNAVLKSIRPDTSDPANKKLLVFSLEGEVSDGQNLTLSIGDRSANYDMIVPNSAIREDNNGKFVLKVEVKNSPLGNRYKATRVDVEVIAEDDTHSAIKGALYNWDYVVTTSTKPIEAGQLIRLSGN